jgi:hypothetical protein
MGNIAVRGRVHEDAICAEAPGSPGQILDGQHRAFAAEHLVYNDPAQWSILKQSSGFQTAKVSELRWGGGEGNR